MRWDADLLAECGLTGLAPADAQDLLTATYRDLELRVGERLSAGLSDDLLDEFSSFIDHDMERVRAWIAEHRPDYATDPGYEKLAETLPEASADRLLCEYASLAWIGVHRPDYSDIVDRVVAEIKAEIVQHRDVILRVIAGGSP